MNALQALYGTCWAITPEALDAIEEIALSHSVGEKIDWEALSKRAGLPLEYGIKATRRGPNSEVAVIPVDGPIFPRANMMTHYSGGVSAQALARDLTASRDDSTVKHVVLAVSSPGGSVENIEATAALIAEVARDKPVYVHGSGMICSAAYWLASAATKIYASPTAMVGSIGVMARFPKRDKEILTIKSTKSPKKNLDPWTKEGQAEVLAQTDAIYEMFAGDVAKYRKVPQATVEAKFGEGGVFLAAEATERGMIDGVMAFEDLIASLAPGEDQAVRARKEAERAQREAALRQAGSPAYYRGETDDSANVTSQEAGENPVISDTEKGENPSRSALENPTRNKPKTMNWKALFRALPAEERAEAKEELESVEGGATEGTQAQLAAPAHLVVSEALRSNLRHAGSKWAADLVAKGVIAPAVSAVYAQGYEKLGVLCYSAADEKMATIEGSDVLGADRSADLLAFFADAIAATASGDNPILKGIVEGSQAEQGTQVKAIPAKTASDDTTNKLPDADMEEMVAIAAGISVGRLRELKNKRAA